MARILRSHATGAVSGGSQGVGGLVGFNSSGNAQRNHRRSLCDRSRDRHIVRRRTGRHQPASGAYDRHLYAAGTVSVMSSTVDFIVRRRTGRQQPGIVTRFCATGAVDVTSTFAAASATVGGRADWQQRQHGYGHPFLRDRCGQGPSAAGTTATGGLIGRKRRRGHRHSPMRPVRPVPPPLPGSAMAGGLIGRPRQHTVRSRRPTRPRAASAVSTSSTGSGRRLDRQSPAPAPAPVTSSYWDTDTRPAKANARRQRR